MFKAKQKKEGFSTAMVLVNQNLKNYLPHTNKITPYLLKHSSVAGNWRRIHYLFFLAYKNC
jgi:hypothetical protein